GAPASDGYTLERYADDLVAVLDALGIRTAVLCGLSMGGYVIFELLRRHAGRVRAIVLADTKAEADSEEGKRGRDELAALATERGPDAVSDRLLPRLLAPATLATQPEVAVHVREMARRWTVPGLVGALRTLRDRPDSTATLRAVRVPTLVVGAAASALCCAGRRGRSRDGRWREGGARAVRARRGGRAGERTPAARWRKHVPAPRETEATPHPPKHGRFLPKPQKTAKRTH